MDRAPHDIAAEEAMLGAALISRVALDEMLRACIPAAFFRPTHQHVFEAMRLLRSLGQPVDAVTVSDELRRTGLLAEVGGTAALLGLTNATPAVSNVSRYASIVMACYGHRQLILAASEISTLGFNRDSDALEKARGLLGNVIPIRGEAARDLTTAEEFGSREAEMRRPWVVPGLFREAHRTIIVGPEGRGKGVLLRQIWLAVSQGRHPFDPRLTFEPGTGLYVDLENPPDAVQHQIGLSRPVLERLGGGWIPGTAFMLARENGMDLRSPAARIELEATIEKVRPKLLVIGPVNKAFRKRQHEDHGDVAGDAIQFLDDMRIRYSCAIFLEAHAAKGNAGGRDMDPAGSQQWMAAPEFGRGMIPDGPSGDKWSKIDFRPFRGDRAPSNWPTHLHRRMDPSSMALPWIGHWERGGMPTQIDMHQP